jgi:long-chain acyl-CoA synthetase
MDRHGALRESLRIAASILKEGRILLIFPEGTRSPTGAMTDFKPSIGYLALQNQVDIVPIFLEGTFEALPKGSVWPSHRQIAAHIGPTLTYDALRAATLGVGRSEMYREAARIVEDAVRRLDPSTPRVSGKVGRKIDAASLLGSARPRHDGEEGA